MGRKVAGDIERKHSWPHLSGGNRKGFGFNDTEKQPAPRKGWCVCACVGRNESEME